MIDNYARSSPCRRGAGGLTLGQPQRGNDRHAVDARASAEGVERDRAAGILDYAVDELDAGPADLHVRLAARAQYYPTCNRKIADLAQLGALLGGIDRPARSDPPEFGGASGRVRRIG